MAGLEMMQDDADCWPGVTISPALKVSTSTTVN